MKMLSIVIPAHNEARTIEKLLSKVLAIQLPGGMRKEIIVVEDCSNDDTFVRIKKVAKGHKEIRVFENERNLGKSRTVRRGILKSRGQLVIIQDADLEYNPDEISLLVSCMEEDKKDVVYGNRFAKKFVIVYYHYYLGNRFISFLSNIFTFPRIRVWIPDVEVCYKLIDGKVARSIAHKLTSKSMFGLEPEITARLSRYTVGGKHLRFGIVPVSYKPRDKSEGKHLQAFRDGSKAVWEIVKYNTAKL